MAPQQIFFEKVYKWSKNCLARIFLLRMARKLGSPSLSRLEVSRDLELKNKARNTGLGLGLVAEMNLVELRLVAKMNLVEHGQVADICCRWTRIGVMAADMWWW